MKKIYLFVTSLFFAQFLIPTANAMLKVNAIGSSPKGQYIAFEEYGTKSNGKVAFSKIRIMNVWKNQYVEKAISVKDEEDNLLIVRQKARALAQKKLKAFNIKI